MTYLNKHDEADESAALEVGYADRLAEAQERRGRNMNLFNGGYQMRDDSTEEGRLADSLPGTVAEYLAEHIAKDAIIKTLLGMLQAIEWVEDIDDTGIALCPSCYQEKKVGHAGDESPWGACRLAAAIALATEANDEAR